MCHTALTWIKLAFWHQYSSSNMISFFLFPHTGINDSCMHFVWHWILSDIVVSLCNSLQNQIISVKPLSCHASCSNVYLSHHVSFCAAALACQLPCRPLWCHNSRCFLSFTSCPMSPVATVFNSGSRYLSWVDLLSI